MKGESDIEDLLFLISFTVILLSLFIFLFYVIFFAITDSVDWKFIEFSFEGTMARILLALVSGAVLLIISINLPLKIKQKKIKFW